MRGDAMGWTQADAIALCRRIEEVAPAHGFHVALTGGCLYKDGARKDCDLLFYKVRQREVTSLAVGFKGLIAALRGIGFKLDLPSMEWCVRAVVDGKRVDMFFPDADEGDYDSGETWTEEQLEEWRKSGLEAPAPNGVLVDDDINF
jgi:hypothetical protein